jgi:hypothetical protein
MRDWIAKGRPDTASGTRGSDEANEVKAYDRRFLLVRF